MEKLASQMLDKLKDWANENPELVKSTLIASGLGATAAAALTGKESKHELTKTRVKRRIKNALLGALAAGGSVGLLYNAGKNFSNAKLQSAPTPGEEFDASMTEFRNSTGDLIGNTSTSAGILGAGGLFGLYRSKKNTDRKAALLINKLQDDGLNLLGTAKDGLKAEKGGFRGAAKALKNDLNATAIANFYGGLTDPIEKTNWRRALRAAGTDFAHLGPNAPFTNKLVSKLQGLARRNWRIPAYAAGAGLGAYGLGELIKED